MNNKHFLGKRVSSFEVYDTVGPITGIALLVDDDNEIIAGTDDGYVMEIECPYGTQAMANNLLSSLQGKSYHGYRSEAAELVPEAELGDGITVNNLYSMLAYRSVAFGGGHLSEIAAPGESELEHEYPYKSQAERQIERKIATTRSMITKTAEEIRLEVSNELDSLSSSIDMKIGSITSTVQGLNGKISTLEQTDSEIRAEITDQINGLSSSIDVKLGSITSTVQGLDGRVTTVEQTTSGLTTSVQGLNGQISTLKQTDSSLQSQITGINGNISTLQQTDSSLQSQITGVNGSISTLDQKIDSISLSVSNGTNSSTISLTVDGVTVASKTIQFTGDVVFASNLTDGTTTISGSNILTGEISAEYLKLGGTMDVYSSLNDSNSSGWLGYVTGKIGGSRFTGIGMVATEDTAVLASAFDDVLILSVDDTGIVAGNNINLQASSMVCIDSDYLTPRYNENTYCGSYSYWWYDGYFKSLHVDGSAITSSDRRLKENIDYDISKWLTMFDLLKPCSYKFIEGKRTHVGMIAQEVIEAGETAGLDMEHLTAVCLDEDSQMYGLRYEEFVPILIAKVQQLEKRLEVLST